MDSPFSPLEFSLLNTWQHGFPLIPRPFAALAAKETFGGTAPDVDAGPDEATVLATLGRLCARGAISRIGPVFAPQRVGSGTLAALAAPAHRLDAIAAQINAHPGVNHNYQRAHHYNLWFVVTAVDAPARAATLRAIEAQTGCAVIAMPLVEAFHIDLGFDLRGGHGGQSSHGGHGGTAGGGGSAAPSAATRAAHRAGGHDAAGTDTAPTPRVLGAQERILAAHLQDGLRLCPAPYAHAAAQVGMREAAVLHALQGWLDEGLLKRFGVVVRHHELGYRANAMLVFDVPDAAAHAAGLALAREPGVSLCYRRARSLPHWPYNLYCMLHARHREALLALAGRLAQRIGERPEILFSVRRFKQCGARYF